ncbi:multiple epidermal growth factor-like domains protein 10 isoform X1 [Haliotis rufescens]|uniref:multiple epidermal growth factor-like domains protein 10 isoform X1 n=1 Tax=Haliotis rufescens TaxID=6454 RepID=UPI00201EB28F|nr:multiple epidermal growth factor-like domains protein 10 isoform X1 [Haliotis rufescens]XP_048239103.1 multiple epidermal growth factor-like domains protein 10 isoform X1 [Haliotis rufescens]
MNVGHDMMTQTTIYIILFFSTLGTVVKVGSQGITDCGCTSGCSYPPTPCVSRCITGRDGSFCQRRNIALGRSTEQTGSFNDTAFCPSPDPSFGRMLCGVKNSSLAVDGDADHNYWHGTCTHTVPHNTTARWSVNFGDSHVISHVVIHTDEDQPSTFKTFQLYVNDQWCQNWTARSDGDLVADITCVRALIGSNLTILSPPGPGNQNLSVLDLCEVLVYECSDFWFGFKCDKRCYCNNTSEVCHKVTGHCLSGCARGRAGADCQMINVALARNAIQSSTYKGLLCANSTSPQCETSANHAVDGDTRSINGSCSYTNSGQPSSFWSVDLEKTRDIHSFRIYNNKDHLDYLRGFKVTVDGAACYQADTTATPPAVIDFNCTDVISGSNVTILLPSALPGQRVLSLCEVEIYECDDFKYGLDCEATCSCKDVTEVCNKTTGYCRSGCTPGLKGQSCTQGCRGGHYGVNCSGVCGHCAYGSVCHTVTGKCPDGLCEGWWTGDRCHDCRKGTYPRDERCEPCLACEDDDCDITGTCLRGCRAGYSGELCNETCVNNTYGANCAFDCGACHNNVACDIKTGQCAAGCEPGFTEELCQNCRAGLYGEGCNMTCGRCASTECEKDTGRCPRGCETDFGGQTCTDCIDGRYGPMCQKVCGHCRYGENCDRVTGNCTHGCQGGWTGRMCLACRLGYYGQTCFPCGHCLGDVACNMTSGLCPGNCDPGWTSNTCSQGCPVGYYGDNCTSECGNCADNFRCSNVDGSCPVSRCAPGYKGTLCTTECPNGFYGSNCKFPCGMCLHNASCNKTSGLCPGGQCMEGYKPPRCHGGCPSGTIGIHCRHSCDHCLDLHCDVVTGRCNNSDCAPGWTGDLCMTVASPSQSGIQPWGIALAVLLPLLAVVGAGVALWWKCRRAQKDHSDQEMANVRRPPRQNTR